MKKNVWIMNHHASVMYFDRNWRHYNFAKYLKQAGYEPVVFCANSKHGVPERWFETDELWHEHMAEEIGVPFLFVRARTYVGNGKQRVLNMIDFYRNVKKAAKEYAKQHGKPDIIYASSVHPLTLVAGIQLARHYGVKCVCEVRDLWPEGIFAVSSLTEKSLIGRILVMGEHWIYHKADAMIFTKEGDCDYLREHGWTTEQGGDIDLAKCHYINNGLDMKQYLTQIETCQVADPDLETDAFRVVYAGTIRRVNHVGMIVEAAELLRDKPGIQFLVYGSGDEEESLRQRAAEKGLTNIKFKGLVEKKYIPYILSRASVNLLHYAQNQNNWSRGNSSNKLFEYMASGKPVISTIQMGYSIIKKYQCGVELDENTPQALADAILRFQQMPKEQYDAYGRNARSGAEDFDFTHLTEKLLSVFGEVCPDIRRIEN